MINTTAEFKTVYWDYYLSIEKEFMDIAKYIPIDEQNSNTFSISYMKLYFSICSEFDVVCKEFIEYVDGIELKDQKANIGAYKDHIIKKDAEFIKKDILYSIDKSIRPFEAWQSANGKSDWWESYNKIKHKRTFSDEGKQNYKKATQKNVVHSLGGLYQLEMYFYREIIDKTDPQKIEWLRIPVPQSEIFRIKDWPDNKLLIDNRYTFHIENGHLIGVGDIK